MSSRPPSQRSNGGIDWVASSWIARSARPCRIARTPRRSARAAPGPPRRADGRRRASCARVERRASALERAVDRGDARVEELRDLGRLPAQHLAEDEHGALARRQMLERGDEGEPDRLARHGDVGRVSVSGNDERRPASGSIQVTSGSVSPGARRGCPAGPRSIGRARRSRPLEHVEADVRRDAVEPRAQRRAALEAVDAPPRAQEGLLDGVLRLERRARACGSSRRSARGGTARTARRAAARSSTRSRDHARRPTVSDRGGGGRARRRARAPRAACGPAGCRAPRGRRRRPTARRPATRPPRASPRCRSARPGAAPPACSSMGRVEPGDDLQIRLDGNASPLARPLPVLVDDAHRSRRRPSRAGCRSSRARRARDPDSPIRRASARRPRCPPSARSPSPTSRSGAARLPACAGTRASSPGASVKRSPAPPPSSPARSGAGRSRPPPSALRAAAPPRSPSRSSHAPFARPRNARPPDTEVEHRDLAGDLVRMERERIERGRAEPDLLRHPRHEQKRADRRLVEQVVVDGEGRRSRRPPRGGRGPRTPPAPGSCGAGRCRARAAYVSSSVTSTRSPIRSIRITTRSSGSGQATSGVLLEPVLGGKVPHLRGG